MLTLSSMENLIVQRNLCICCLVTALISNNNWLIYSVLLNKGFYLHKS